MAVDFFLKLDGIKGESRDSKHTDQIDVLSWSFGAVQHGKAGSQSGASSSKVDVADLTITKYLDVSSPNLLIYCCNGKHISTGTLSCCKASGDEAIEYLKLEMKEIIVSSYQTGGTSSDDRQIESVSLNFASINDTYTVQTATGTKGQTVVQGWDVAKNIKL